MAKQLLGKEVTAALNERIKAKVAELEAKGVKPTLGIIRVGERSRAIFPMKEAQRSVVRPLALHVRRSCFRLMYHREELLKVIDDVNKNDAIHGVLLFRPLPKHLNAVQCEIENALDPAKDVDCMTDGSMSGRCI